MTHTTSSRPIIWISILAATAMILTSAPGSAADCSRQDSRCAAAAVTPEGVQQVEIAVTPQGFVPAEIHVKAGRPVRLVVTRETATTCATSIVIKDFGIDRELPLSQPVEITFTPAKTGTIRYACAMDMLGGVLIAD